jgi:hypothetical protein
MQHGDYSEAKDADAHDNQAHPRNFHQPTVASHLAKLTDRRAHRPRPERIRALYRVIVVCGCRRDRIFSTPDAATFASVGAEVNKA